MGLLELESFVHNWMVSKCKLPLDSKTKVNQKTGTVLLSRDLSKQFKNGVMVAALLQAIHNQIVKMSPKPFYLARKL